MSGHADVGQHQVEQMTRALGARSPFLRVRAKPAPGRPRPENRRQACCGRTPKVVDQAAPIARLPKDAFLAAEQRRTPRQEVADVDHFGSLALDSRRAENAFRRLRHRCGAFTSTMSMISATTRPIERPSSGGGGTPDRMGAEVCTRLTPAICHQRHPVIAGYGTMYAAVAESVRSCRRRFFQPGHKAQRHA